MMGTSPRAEEILRESEGWVSNLDRTRLGLFAVPHRVLVIRDAIQKAVELKDWEVRNELSFMFPIATAAEYSEIPYRVTRVIAEFHFWKKREGELPRPFEAKIELQIQRLGVLLDKPHVHDYFLADVFDIPFIEQCIAEGIEPSLASSIMMAA